MNRSVPVHIVRKSWIILGPKRLFLNQMHQSLLTASRHGWLGCACSTEIGRNSALPTIVVVAVVTDRADCVWQIRCNVVAPHPKPEGWARAQWLGSEDAVDGAGQLTYCHGMLRPVYLNFVFNVRWDIRQGCRHGLDDVGQEAEENGDEEDGDHAQPGGEHRYEELDKQMTTMERHKTFRKNAKLWLDSAPEGRLLTLKQVHHIQQSSQTQLLSQCGVTWEVNQLKKEASGKGSAAFRCLLLHDGEYTTKFMSKYNQLTRSPDLGDVMAPHEKTHASAGLIFRSASVSSCATFMLEVVPQEQYPFIPAGLVHQSVARRRVTSCRMEDDFKYRPCIMDPYWFGLMMKGNDDSAKLLHPALLAQAKLFYYLAEGDNGSVEALNAALRRQVVANVQCKTFDIEDLSAAFVIRSSSEEALSVFGDGHPPDLSEDAVNGGTGGGGGGLMRAFISQYKDEHKDDKGIIDFKSAHVAYNRERDLPQSDVLDNLKPVAEAATEASRALRRMYGTCTRAPQSSFVTISGVARKQMETRGHMQMLLNDMGILDDSAALAQPSTAIVPVALGGMAELVS